MEKQDNRWVINRAGLVNFWYYDEEIFEFSNGRLLLRGSNGSGKSVTMQSFIPLLLDGNKSPERLDPFGSKARKIENYILGDDDNGKEESIGYLFMEFKKKVSNNLITIGMGFRAKRGKPMTSWGFSINDGRQIGKDFFLYKQVGEKIPLTMRELQNRLADGGQVVEGQKNYMKMVNDLIFGFDDLDEYDELVKLLVQLRSPKLSKEFKPTVIYEIMENSLQPLSEDDLRPMSEAIENMDNIKSRLEVLKVSKSAADRIRNAFDRYNQYLAANKSQAYLKTRQDYQQAKLEQAQLSKNLDTAQKELQELQETITDLSIQLTVQEDKKKELEKHDSVGIREKILSAEDEIARVRTQKEMKDRQHENKRQLERDLLNQVEEEESQLDLLEKDLLAQLEEMSESAQVFDFDEHGFMLDEIKKDLTQTYDFHYINGVLEQMIKSLGQAVLLLTRQKMENAVYQSLLAELDELKKQQEEMERFLDQANRQLMETQEEALEKIYFSQLNNQELKLGETALTEVSRAVRQFGPDCSPLEINGILEEEYHLCDEVLREALLVNSGKQAEIDQKRLDKEAEIDEWNSMKEAEPKRDEAIIKSRQKLAELGIPCLPLYKALDFTAESDKKTQGLIEEALTDMGILDALIMPEAYRDRVLNEENLHGDKYLFAEPKLMVHTINQYLQVDDAVSDKQEVQNILNSILIDESHHTRMDEAGNYRLGILHGQAAGENEPRYIGFSARKKYWEERRAELKGQLAQLLADLDDLGTQKTRLQERRATLKREFLKLFNAEDLITAADDVKKAIFDVTSSSQQLAQKNKEEEKRFKILKDLNEELFQVTRRFELTLDIETYEQAQEAANTYFRQLHQLEKKNIKLVNLNDTIKSLKNRYQEVLAEIDDLIYELNQFNKNLTTLEMTLKNLQDQLALSDYQMIQAEIEKCLKAIKEIPQQKEEAIKGVERLKINCQRIRQDKDDLENRISHTHKTFDLVTMALQEELALGYLENNPDQSLADQAAAILQEYPPAESQNKEKITMRLKEIFMEQSQYLRDFSVTSHYIFEDDSANPEIGSLRQRLNITAKLSGKVVNFLVLSDYLKESLTETEQLLRDSDRELFEEILLKNISKKISARIFHSEKWVANMNRLMEKMDTSMGLSFSLRWASRKAETEEQLDTKELVNLLKMDGNLLREEDMNILSEHFRSKISLARRLLEDKGIDQTFHAIMRDILDYRKWFEFKLFFKKTGQQSKELTNNAFFKFSGGEKAMAMYVPLFSAVNARYEGANKDTARLLSLDEAFAGVDEQNIRDMFRLLNELDLSYILNSQILWGDYDTVDALAISELIRPDNADFVTVLRYHWNGKVRKLVMDDAS